LCCINKERKEMDIRETRNNMKLEIKTTLDIEKDVTKCILDKDGADLEDSLEYERNKRWVSVESIYPDVKEFYTRLDNLMNRDEYEKEPVYVKNELAKLKKSIIDCMKELEEK
jgi:hypothetical protein